MDAAKTGMLASSEDIDAGAALWPRAAVKLLRDEAIDAFSTRLLPLAAVITRNLPEAKGLRDRCIQSIAEHREAARELVAFARALRSSMVGTRMRTRPPSIGTGPRWLLVPGVANVTCKHTRPSSSHSRRDHGHVSVTPAFGALRLMELPLSPPLAKSREGKSKGTNRCAL